MEFMSIKKINILFVLIFVLSAMASAQVKVKAKPVVKNDSTLLVKFLIKGDGTTKYLGSSEFVITSNSNELDFENAKIVDFGEFSNTHIDYTKPSLGKKGKKCGVLIYQKPKGKGKLIESTKDNNVGAIEFKINDPCAKSNLDWSQGNKTVNEFVDSKPKANKLDVDFEDIESILLRKLDSLTEFPVVKLKGNRIESTVSKDIIWYKNGVPYLAGIPSFDAIESGVYTAKVKDKCGYEHLSEPFTHVITAVDEVVTQNSLVISPNPVKESAELSVGLADADNVIIDVIAKSGLTIQVFTGVLNAGTTTIPFVPSYFNLAAGKYQIKVSGDNTSLQQSLLIVK